MRKRFRDIIKDNLYFIWWEVNRMSDSMEVRKRQYKDWAKDNLGEKTGIWYAPYLEKLGSLLNRFGLK